MGELVEMVRPRLSEVCTTTSAAAFHMRLFLLAVVPSAQVTKDQAKLNKGSKGRKRSGNSSSLVDSTSAKDKKNESGSKKRRGSSSRDDRIIGLPTVPSLKSIVVEDFRKTIATLAQPAPDKPPARKKSGSKSGEKAQKRRRKGAS